MIPPDIVAIPNGVSMKGVGFTKKGIDELDEPLYSESPSHEALTLHDPVASS